MNDADRRKPDVVWHPSAVGREERPTAGLTVWITGLSGAGKSTLGVALERCLIESGRPAYLLDGDNLRHGLTSDLGFTSPDRRENVRRVGEVARMFADAGLVAVAALISPVRIDREHVRNLHVEAGLRFVEVHVATPLATCEARDPKGMYERARSGTLPGFTGVHTEYEAPREPEIVVRPEDGPAADVAAGIARYIGGGANEVFAGTQTGGTEWR